MPNFDHVVEPYFQSLMAGNLSLIALLGAYEAAIHNLGIDCINDAPNIELRATHLRSVGEALNASDDLFDASGEYVGSSGLNKQGALDALKSFYSV